MNDFQKPTFCVVVAFFYEGEFVPFDSIVFSEQHEMTLHFVYGYIKKRRQKYFEDFKKAPDRSKVENVRVICTLRKETGYHSENWIVNGDSDL